MTAARDIPVANTPPGGYGTEMPPPILAGCDEAVVDGAPDLRGTWHAVDAVDGDGARLAEDNPMWRHVERIEQAGQRVVITGGGIVHDMVADGTLEHGVHDVMAIDFRTPVHVVAAYEDGVLVLRPDGLPGVEVRRWREGERLVWRYHTLFTLWLERVSASP